MSPDPGAHDVVLRVGGSPENVRTARLVAAAVARREGLPEDRVDEVRIAVGEAVTSAMRSEADHAVELVLGPGDASTFVVRVAGGIGSEPAPAEEAANGSVDDGLALALLRGLADDVVIAGGTTVLTWNGGTAG